MRLSQAEVLFLNREEHGEAKGHAVCLHVWTRQTGVCKPRRQEAAWPYFVLREMMPDTG